jgi:hypothetical protein
LNIGIPIIPERHFCFIKRNLEAKISLTLERKQIIEIDALCRVRNSSHSSIMTEHLFRYSISAFIKEMSNIKIKSSLSRLNHSIATANEVIISELLITHSMIPLSHSIVSLSHSTLTVFTQLKQ